MDTTIVKKYPYSKYQKKYYLENRDKILARHKKNHSTEEYKKNKKKYDKLYWKANRERLIPLKIKKKKLRRKKDPIFKLKDNLRRRINNALKYIGVKKSKKSLELLGVPDIEFLWKYLENKFKPGMTRENYGKLWHIDHIKPCISFDLSKIEEQFKCFNYTNLQPLWASENLSKSSKIID
jgi:hypothetical protein